MSADSDLIAGIVGGTSAIFGWYDRRGGENVSGSNLTSWDDYRGSVGFGPTGTAHSNPTVDVNGIITCDGAASYLDWPINAGFNPTNGKTLILIGSAPSGGGGAGYALQIADSVGSPTTWVTLNTQNPNLTLLSNNGGLNNLTSVVPVGSTRRMLMMSWTARDRFGAQAPTPAEVSLLIRDGLGQGLASWAVGGSSFPAGSWLMCAGHFGSYFVPMTIAAILVIDHPVTGAEWAALRTWADAVHSPYFTPVSANSGLVLFGGNSIVYGSGAVVGTSDFPTLTMAQPGLSTNRDYLNLGVPSERGTNEVTSFPTRIAPFLRSSHRQKVYVCWELHNDLNFGLTGAQAAAKIGALCAAAKAEDANVRTIAATCIGGSDVNSNPEAAAANALLRDAGWRQQNSVDYLADIEAISGFGLGSQNLSWYAADQIHPNATGNAVIATHATNGFAAWIGAAFITPTGPAAPVDSLYHASLPTMRDGPWGMVAQALRALGSTLIPSLETALLVDDAAVAVTADNVALVQQNTLVVADASAAVAADTVDLTQQNALAAADVSIAVSADNVDLVQQNVLAANNVAVAVTAENVALDVATPLAPADSAIAITAESPALTQQQLLAVADALLAVAIEAPALVQQSILAVADSIAALALESPVLIATGGSLQIPATATSLTHDDLSTSITIDSLLLTLTPDP